MARRRPKRRSRKLVRLLAVGGLALVAFLYVRPLRTYFATRHTLEQRSAEVRGLEAEKQELERQLARSATGEALVREARLLSLVKPGERLFIVKGIPQWRHAHRTSGHG